MNKRFFKKCITWLCTKVEPVPIMYGSYVFP